MLARGLLPYAALLHLGFTAWAMTSPTQFSKVPHHCIQKPDTFSPTTCMHVPSSSITLRPSQWMWMCLWQSTLSLSTPSSLLHGHASTGSNSTSGVFSSSPHPFGVLREASIWARVFNDHKVLPLVLVGVCLAAYLCIRLVKALLGGPLSLLEKWLPCMGLWFRPEFEWQSLQPFFAAIPTERLEYAISVSVAKPDILARWGGPLGLEWRRKWHMKITALTPRTTHFFAGIRRNLSGGSGVG